MKMSDKCIWVVGASGGIGRCLALQLAQQNNFVIVSGRNRKSLARLVAEGGGRIKALPFDLTDGAETLEQVRTQLNEITDYLDGFIFAAGVCEYEDRLTFESEMYRRMMEVNFLGAVSVMGLAKPFLMRSKDRPMAVFIGSLTSVLGLPRAEAYGASKAALEYFVRSLRADCAKLPLDIRLVRPGFVTTPMTAKNDFPMPLLMTPENAAARIIKGLSGPKFIIDFPYRLSAGLKLLDFFKSAWLSWVAPKITRHDLHSWKGSP